jgi:N-acetylglutamate synthase-like GNAT family acetyltransferase
MIRVCAESDSMMMLEIINDAAQAYKGVIPDECWNEQYISSEELICEIENGVIFWCLEQDEQLLGIMGIQDKGELTLIRHAYIRRQAQKLGIGTKLLQHMENITEKPILIGTWAAAIWAISFYEKNGYTLVSEEEKNQLLKNYWSVPERQKEKSVVLANQRWNKA